MSFQIFGSKSRRISGAKEVCEPFFETSKNLSFEFLWGGFNFRLVFLRNYAKIIVKKTAAKPPAERSEANKVPSEGSLPERE